MYRLGLEFEATTVHAIPVLNVRSSVLSAFAGCSTSPFLSLKYTRERMPYL